MQQPKLSACRRVLLAWLHSQQVDYDRLIGCPECALLPHEEQVMICDATVLGLKRQRFARYKPPTVAGAATHPKLMCAPPSVALSAVPTPLLCCYYLKWYLLKVARVFLLMMPRSNGARCSP